MKILSKVSALLLVVCLLLCGCEEPSVPSTSTSQSTSQSTPVPSGSSQSETTLPPQTDPTEESTLPPQTDPSGESTLPPTTEPEETVSSTGPAPTQPQPTEPKPTVPKPTQPSKPVEQPDENSSFRIDFIDVGQADAALVRCDGEAMLIDGGNAADSNVIYTYLQKQGVTHLDYIICTHAHEDHVGGLSGALNYATVTTAFSPVTSYTSKVFNNFKNNLDKQGVGITVPSHGDIFDLGSAECQVVGPIYDSDEPNNTSIVLRIEYGSTSFLFTGDAETAEENDILDAGYDLDCDVLKVGHHGSDTSTSYRWLRQVSPEYAVISVGTGNSYGHPTETVLSRLRDADVTVYRTDLQGDIICTSDGKTVSFTTSRNQNADTLQGAGEGGGHTGSTDAAEARDYVLNTNSHKFHFPSCSSAKKISDKNRQEVTCTREELIEDGYSPCGICDP